MNKRVKEIRSLIGLNQTDFGKKIGVSRDTIANIEGERIDLKDVLLKSIAREFNVNETWLRTGDGEMFITLPEEDAYFKAATLLQDNPSIVALVTEYYNSSDEFKREFENFLDRVIQTRQRLKDEGHEN